MNPVRKRGAATMRVLKQTRRPAAAMAASVAVCLAFAASASASQKLRIDPMSASNVAPGGILDYRVQVTNLGDTPFDGSVPVTVTGTLPRGFTVADPAGPVSDPRSPHYASTNGFPLNFGLADFGAGLFPCTQTDGVTPLAGGETEFTCTNPNPSSTVWEIVHMPVSVAGNVTPGAVLSAHFTVEGGGAANPAAAADHTSISATPAGFGIDGFDAEVLNAAGEPETQAGGHPAAASVSIDFNTLLNPVPLGGTTWPVEPTKDVSVDLPPGFIGNPTAGDQCTLAELAHNGASFQPLSLCATTSQVGTVLIRLQNQQAVIGPYPVFNMVPPPNVPARFGFNVLGSIVVLDGKLRSGSDYGLTVSGENIPEPLGIIGTTFTFWGVPSDASHDGERACSGRDAPSDGGPTCRSGAPTKAFLRNPTSCTSPGVGLPTTVHIDSWIHPGAFDTATSISHLPPGFPSTPGEWGPQQGPTGCDRVPFNPSFSARPPPPTKVNVPAGFTFDLSMPQTDDPDLIGHADLKKAVVTLPLGVRVSPSSADGLGACAPAQIGLDNGDLPSCPDSSKVGAVTIDTPLLAKPLAGSIYLAKPNDNPFGTLLSIYLVAEGPGVVVKLPGRVDADPISGQLTATFDDNPQLPFSNLHLEFKSGPRAPLVTPRQCGTYVTHAELTSWSDRTVVTDSPFTVSKDGNGAPCSAPQFSPSFNAGTDDPVAGTSSTFRLSLSRSDDDEEVKALTIDMPSGLTGKIASADLCSAVAARAGTCPEGSRVGSVTVGAGAGSNPFYITSGRAYITGPYKGAPFGLSIVVPAVAGPFDLGNVVVQSSIFVDKHTAELRVVSDPLPTVLQGIPLDVRDVRVAVDKPGFFVNPTSCAAKTIRGVIDSVGGKTANVSSHFQVGECSHLPLKPKMQLVVGARGRTGKGASTPFTATLTQTKGQSNLKSVKVTLPTTINARLDVVNQACTRDQFEHGNCAKARAGSAVAVTPLLRDPLRGSAFFVRNGHPLPDLFVALRGQVDFDLIGRITIPGSKHLSTTFETVPDVPISSFSLQLVAGRQGPIGTAANLCTARARRAKAQLDFVGQNGRVLQVDQRLVVKGCAKGGRRGHRRH